MVRAARDMAAAHGGRLADDNGRSLDEQALAAIRAELDAVRARLAELGIEPGSPLALRVFS
jgi:FtsZ-interacting cell division protein ZipA